jgi:hypothetical protein
VGLISIHAVESFDHDGRALMVAEPTKSEKRLRQKAWFVKNATSLLLALVGLTVLQLMLEVARDGSDGAAVVLATIGGGALLIAPFGSRLAGVLKIGPVELNLRERAMAAVAAAPAELVNGILPLLESRRIGVEQVVMPHGGLTLTSPSLGFMRQDLKVAVVGVRPPGQSEWLTGGEIADLELPAGSLLLVAGPRDALPELRKRVADVAAPNP